jgi:hypothetical protein
MSSNYRNDQWFGLQNEDFLFTPINAGPSRLRAGYNLNTDNKPFVYPDRLVRTQGVNGELTSTPLKRGYIRSLLYDAGQASVVRKCAFQFNPESLTHSVNSSTTLQNPLFLDPASFATPIMGDVTFVFDLLFDRSMELNNATPEDEAASREFDINSNDSLWLDSPPSQVGVLHDLAAFYRVIGQGFYEDTLNTQLNTLSASNEGTAASQAQNLGNILNDPFGVNQPTGVLAPSSSPSIDSQFVNANIGNVAFLVPLPVRVMFSSLYMVEGFVSQVTVTFHKFTTNMVPMTCTINVSMAAKYIGFARKNSALTASLVDAKEAAETQAEQKQQEKLEVVEAFKKAAANMEVGLYGDNAILGKQPKMDDLSAYGLDNLLQFPGLPYRLAVRFPNGPQPVSDLYSRGANINVSPSATLSIYGPFEPSAVPSGRALAEQTRVADDFIRNILEISPQFQLLNSSLTPKKSTGDLINAASDKDGWEKITTGAWSGSKTTSTGWDDAVGLDFDPYGKYYLIDISASLVVTYDGVPTTANGRRAIFVAMPDSSPSTPQVLFSVPLTWTTSSVPASDGGPTAPGSQNPVSRPPVPGSTSNIGQPPVRPANNLTTAKTNVAPVRYS